MSPMFNYWDSPGEFFRQMMIGFDFLIDWAPLWAPFVFGYLFWQNWVRYVRRQFLNGEEHELIEVRLPEDIKKTPQAMEVVLNALHQTGGETTFIDRYWKGSVRPHFSLELVSLEGDIHFFIWTRSFHRQIVENAIYAQYPDVEVRRVPDYTHYVEFSEDKLSLWGCEFKLTKPDAYPIRTYIDYGMQPGQKDEESVDPITPIIEYLGSLQKNEQAWIQIIVRAHKKKRKSGTFLSWTDVRDEGQKLIDEIMGREGSSKKPKAEQVGDRSMRVKTELSQTEQDVVSAIDRNTAKPGFDAGIRGIYLAEEDSFREVNIPGLIGSFKQFGSDNQNGFAPTRGMTQFDYPWQDYKERRQNRTRKRLFQAYQRRGYFYPPHRSPSFILSTEELATIYHFPGGVAQTPTFQRIESKRAEPPTDLPT